MKFRFFAILTFSVLIAAQSAFAEDIRPAFDITGLWKSPDPGYVQYFQNGKQVQFIYVNRGFGHVFTGLYSSPVHFEGMMTRRNRQNGCVTLMWLSYTVNSANEMSLKWTAMDSHCDLQAGRTQEVRLTRDAAMEARLWY